MDRDRIRQFADTVYGNLAGAMTAGMAFLGVRTGLFAAMAGQGPLAPADLATRTGLHGRYVEEWLKGMASAGYLDHDEAAGTYVLPEEHAWLLASEGTDHYMGGLFAFVPILLSAAPAVAEAFRAGGGVGFDRFGPDCVAALDMINAGQYEQRFVSHWLAKLPDVVRRLEAGGRVLDAGCGAGRVGATIARAFPRCEVVGADPDAGSIARAESLAAERGRPANLRFVATGTDTLERGEGFDLITACDCVHDFAAPRRTLTEMRQLLKPGGTLFVVEPKAGDTAAENRHPIQTMYYGFSLFHCMTQSLAAGGPGLGTCMGPRQTRALLTDAGFASVELVDIRSQTNLFYAARA